MLSQDIPIIFRKKFFIIFHKKSIVSFVFSFASIRDEVRITAFGMHDEPFFQFAFLDSFPVDYIILAAVEDIEFCLRIGLERTVPIKMFREYTSEYGNIILFFECIEHIAGKLQYYIIILFYKIYFVQYRIADIADQLYAISRIFEDMENQRNHSRFSFGSSDCYHLAFIIIE